jgi:outer membrane protein assembly factor BamB
VTGLLSRGLLAAFAASGLYTAPPPAAAPVTSSLARPPVIAWRARMPGLPFPSATHSEPCPPVVDGHRLYVGYSGANALFELARADGTLRRRFDAKAPVAAEPWVDERHLIFSDTAGYTFAFARAGDGWKSAWQHFSGAPVVSQPVVVGGVVYFVNVDEQVYALDAETGALRWRHQHKLDAARGTSLELFGAPPAVVEGDTLYAGFSDGFLVALGRDDGTPRWNAQVGEGTYPDLIAPPTAVEGGVVAGGFSEPLLRLEATTRAASWRVDAGSASRFTLDRGALWHGGNDGVLRRLDARTGEVLASWDSKTGGTLSQPLVTDLGILVASSEGTVYLLDRDAGRVAWKLDPGVVMDGIVARPTVSGADIYVVTNGGFVMGLRGAAADPPPERPAWVGSRQRW